MKGKIKVFTSLNSFLKEFRKIKYEYYCSNPNNSLKLNYDYHWLVLGFTKEGREWLDNLSEEERRELFYE